MLCFQGARILQPVGVYYLLCDFQSFVLLFWFLLIVLMQKISIFTGRFIVLMIHFIFASFDILPNFSDFINFHRDTSRIALASSGENGSRFYISFRDASSASALFVIILSSASIFVMYSMVSLIDFMSSLMLSVCSIMLHCLTNSWSFCFVFCYSFDIIWV